MPRYNLPMHSLWMLVASLLFALLAVCVKFAGEYYSVAEIVFYRAIFGVVVLAVFVRWRQLSLSTRLIGMHLGRGATGTVAQAMWFFSTMMLPLGTAMTLNYASPVFLAAFSVVATLAAGKRVDWRLAAAVLIGFVGVLMILQPSFERGQETGALLGVLSGFLSAAAYWHVKELGRLKEPEWRTVFYFCVAGSLLGLIGSLIQGFSPHTLRGVMLLLAIGGSATLAQLAMTRAYGRGPTLVIANLQFSAVVFASILGVAIFADRIGVLAWIGIGVIVLSGIASTAVTFVSRSRAAAAPQGAELVEPLAGK